MLDVKASGRIAASGRSRKLMAATPNTPWATRSIGSASRRRAGPGEPPVEEIEDGGDDQEDEAERARHAPIGGLQGIEGDDGAEHLVVRPADQRRGDVIADR